MFEDSVHNLTNQLVADFLGLTLTNADILIQESGKRKRSYTIQRSRNRARISSVGDITFAHTIYINSCLKCSNRYAKRERQKRTAYLQIITITVLHSRSLLVVVGGYFLLPLDIWYNRPARATMNIPIWIRSEYVT